MDSELEAISISHAMSRKAKPIHTKSLNRLESIMVFDVLLA